MVVSSLLNRPSTDTSIAHFVFVVGKGLLELRLYVIVLMHITSHAFEKQSSRISSNLSESRASFGFLCTEQAPPRLRSRSARAMHLLPSFIRAALAMDPEISMEHSFSEDKILVATRSFGKPILGQA